MNGMKSVPDWERLVSAAVRLQQTFPDAVLAGGTAAALHARHRISRDADHVLSYLSSRFDEALSDIESVAGWKTARTVRPVMILGSLDGIETGIRQMRRSQPLETERMPCGDFHVTVPTLSETLRIKAVLIVRRNAVRDYLDFAALARKLGHKGTLEALLPFDSLYPQENGQSALQQLLAQTASPQPYDLNDGGQSVFSLDVIDGFSTWDRVRDICTGIALTLFQDFPEPDGAVDRKETSDEPADHESPCP